MKNRLKKCVLVILLSILSYGFFIPANTVVASSTINSVVRHFSHEVILVSFNLTTEIVVIVVSLLIAGFVMMILKNGMRTAHKKTKACDYLIRDSFSLKTSTDLFLYSNVTRSAKPKPQNKK